ncbi:hypothetical protein MTR67_049030 [Solanum verrucosum]|uniref:GDP-mannose transporter n=1 Tax=Solanum verrucosum TaxID=315347 RepID=A0AAF0UZH8_SOLVR|nr:hypothetical protein MTR67_049030 [Solanum verrucosum]
MNPRSLPVAASLDAPDPVLERVLIEDTKNSSHGGERNFLAHQPILLDQVSKSFRGEVVSRSFSMKAANRNDENLENGMLERDIEKSVRSNKVVTVHNKALLSGVAYCISSCSMILVNKYVLSSYGFNAGISLMVYQNFVSVVVVSSLRVFGIITTEPLTWRLVRVWLPVNVIFVGMLITSMFSLKYINVAMVTVLKNVTNVITAVGEMYLFDKTHDNKVWTALFLMIISAVTGGITDLSFHAIGYTWQIINCFLTASYSVSTSFSRCVSFSGCYFIWHLFLLGILSL